MLFQYIVEQYIQHAIDIAAWTLVAYLCIRRNYPAAAVIGAIMFAAYLGMNLGENTMSAEDVTWVGISIATGALVGWLLARRAKSTDATES